MKLNFFVTAALFLSFGFFLNSTKSFADSPATEIKYPSLVCKESNMTLIIDPSGNRIWITSTFFAGDRPSKGFELNSAYVTYPVPDGSRFFGGIYSVGTTGVQEPGEGSQHRTPYSEVTDIKGLVFTDAFGHLKASMDTEQSVNGSKPKFKTLSFECKMM